MGVINKFNDALSLWMNNHGFTNIDFVEGEDFCYYYEKHTIQWGLLTNEKIDNYFLQFFYEYGLNTSCLTPFTMSLLHELGHYMTLSNFSNNEAEQDSYAKSMNVSDGSIDSQYWYWELPTEFAANMWAINWANTHPQEFEELRLLCKDYVMAIAEDANTMEQIDEWVEEIRSGNYIPLYIYEEDE